MHRYCTGRRSTTAHDYCLHGLRPSAANTAASNQMTGDEQRISVKKTITCFLGAEPLRPKLVLTCRPIGDHYYFGKGYQQSPKWCESAASHQTSGWMETWGLCQIGLESLVSACFVLNKRKHVRQICQIWTGLRIRKQRREFPVHFMQGKRTCASRARADIPKKKIHELTTETK